MTLDSEDGTFGGPCAMPPPFHFLVRVLSPCQLSFNWGLNPVTSFGPGLVSARWAGKLLAPTTETFNIFLRAQGGIRLFLDHELIIEAWEGICCVIYTLVCGSSF